MRVSATCYFESSVSTMGDGISPLDAAERHASYVVTEER